MSAPPRPPGRAPHRHWWEHRLTAVALAIAMTIPMWWPAFPPLTDLPGHMGRYAIQLAKDDPTNPLNAFYQFDWALIGNLGIDLLIIPMAALFGIELGTKLIVLTIPALTVIGLLWTAREVHGEVPPVALFALPFAYGHPFQFGFINFALAMALALNAFALWLRMARQGRTRRRAWVFALIAPVLWVVHTFGWGTLGVMAFSAELVRQHDARGSWARSVVPAIMQVLPLAGPLILMLAWRSGHAAGATGDWFNWYAKGVWLRQTLRDRWATFDQWSLIIALLLPAIAIIRFRFGLSRNLAASALFLLAVFLILPRIIFGSAYADMRLTPYMIAVALIAVRVPDTAARGARLMAWAGLAFVAVRLIGTTASYGLAARDHATALAALDHVPDGARVHAFVGSECHVEWFTGRNEHLPSLATVRRRAFANDQWATAGAQLVSVRPDMGPRRTVIDPAHIVLAKPCPRQIWRTLPKALAQLPRARADYVWLIDAPRPPAASLAGLRPVWRSDRDTLYEVMR